jgi:phosphohistidine phosphatase
MKRLILLRHAKAVPKEAEDFDRVLAPQGRAEMAPVAAYLAAEPDRRPDLALVSPAARTRETWTLAQAKLGAVATAFEEDIYEAEVDDLIDILCDADGIMADGPTETLILVGHNPGISDLAGALAGSGDEGLLDALAGGMPTAGLAILDFEIGTWRELQPGTGRVQAVVGPDRAAAKPAA